MGSLRHFPDRNAQLRLYIAYSVTLLTLFLRMHLAMDKDRWRALVNTVMNLQVL